MTKHKKKKFSKEAQKSPENKLTNQGLNSIISNQLNKSGVGINQISSIEKPGEIKMSAVILKLADPYIKEHWGNENRIHAIISLAVSVWNMTFLSQDEQEEIQGKFIDTLLPLNCHAKEIAGLMKLFDDLKQRKTELFPDIKKMIVGHNLRLDKNNIQLDISSAPLNMKK